MQAPADKKRIAGQEGRIAAPISGYVIPLSEVSGEAFSSGVLGKGLAIVPSEGKYFSPKVETGVNVHVGELLLEFDLEKIKEAGYDTPPPVLITNYMDFADISGEGDREVKAGEDFLSII